MQKAYPGYHHAADQQAQNRHGLTCAQLNARTCMGLPAGNGVPLDGIVITMQQFTCHSPLKHYMNPGRRAPIVRPCAMKPATDMANLIPVTGLFRWPH